jgi:hypothetical protein
MLVKKFKAGEVITDADLAGLNLRKIGSGGQAAIQLLKISNEESYVIKKYSKVRKDGKIYDETVIVDDTNEDIEKHAKYEI